MKTQKVECSKCENKDKSIFCQLGETELHEVSDHKIMNAFKKGQVLFHEGNPAFGVYCISQGKVKLTKVSGDGKETLLRISGPGDLIGFQQIIHSGVNDMTATALEDTKICFIDRQFLQKTVENKSSVSMELLSHIAKDMMSLQDRLAGFQSKSVRERLAYLLLDLDARYGVTCDEGRRLSVQLTRDEMASMIGVATETLIREISAWRDEGVLSQDGKALILTDLPALKTCANI